jgi:hypothetical protein
MENEQTYYAFWGVTTLFVLVTLCLTVILLFVFYKIPGETGHKTIRRVLEKIELLKLATILIIIIATTYLAIFDKFTESVVAIFSGIAGYVLGTMKQAEKPDAGQLPK